MPEKDGIRSQVVSPYLVRMSLVFAAGLKGTAPIASARLTFAQRIILDKSIPIEVV